GYGWGGERIRFERLDVPPGLVGTPITLEVTDASGGYLLRDGDGAELLRGTVGETAERGCVLSEILELRANPGMTFEVVKRRRLDVVTGLQESINVAEQGKESGILQITYEHTDPALAEAVVQKVSEAYVRQNVERSS